MPAPDPSSRPAASVPVTEGDREAYESFAVYSGRYSDDGLGPVYNNTASMWQPVVEHAPWLFLDLVSGGLVSTSNVSVYLRIYADGHCTYLGPAGRFRAMPTSAANHWNSHARLYGLPEIKRSLRDVA